MTEKYFLDYGNKTTPYEKLKEIGAKDIEKLPSGKPVSSNCFISISHSGKKCAVVKSQNAVGIDLEEIKQRDFLKLSNRFFSEKEKEYFENEKYSAKAFYTIWTRKESYAKLTGEGLKEIFRQTDTFSLSDYVFTTEELDGYILTVCEKK